MKSPAFKIDISFTIVFKNVFYTAWEKREVPREKYIKL